MRRVAKTPQKSCCDLRLRPCTECVFLTTRSTSKKKPTRDARQAGVALGDNREAVRCMMELTSSWGRTEYDQLWIELKGF